MGFFPKNPVLSRTITYGPLKLFQITEESYVAIPDRQRTNGQTNRQTLFHRTLPAMVGCPKTNSENLLNTPDILNLLAIPGLMLYFFQNQHSPFPCDCFIIVLLTSV